MSVSYSGGGPRIQTFRPSMEEMKDFAKYIAHMESLDANKAGIAKIIPPPEYRPRKNGYDDIGHVLIPAPIEQLVNGTGGVYQQFNIQQKPMTVREYKKLAESDRYKTPPHFDYAELIRKFWSNITFNPAIYGADVSGSLYDPGVKEFNINHLNTILDLVNEGYGVKIEGVNTAYLYFGMWKTTFAWHTEDMDLYSINYLHHGAPKTWYAIPPEHGRRFERLATGFFHDSAKKCPSFLRHKMSLISPKLLQHHGIPFDSITQEEGEFMITFPFGYHAGFNHGFNCAESTNFSMPRWVEYGKRATSCTCNQDNVKISMDIFVKTFQPERYPLWLEGKDYGAHPEDPSRIYAAAAPVTSPSKSNLPDPAMDSLVSKRHPIHKKRLQSDDDEFEAEELGRKRKPHVPILVINTKTKTAKVKARTRKIKKEPPLLWQQPMEVKAPIEPLNLDSKLDSPQPPILELEVEEPSLAAQPPKVAVKLAAPTPKGEVDLSDFASQWPPSLMALWQHRDANQAVERTFNQHCAAIFPHCAVCLAASGSYQLGRFPLPGCQNLPAQSPVLLPLCFLEGLPSTLLTPKGASPLLTCTDCGLTVHMACYGALDVTHKSLWQCARCSRSCHHAACGLCRLRGGPLKPTTDSRWAHISCALFFSDIFFEDPLNKEPINISFMSSLRRKQVCRYCQRIVKRGPKYRGACLSCTSPECQGTFHVTCGMAAGATLGLQQWPAPHQPLCAHSLHILSALASARTEPAEEAKLPGEEEARIPPEASSS